MAKQTRRVFLKQTLVAATAAAAMPRIARADANSQVRIAVIGFNGRGMSHISEFKDHIVALCDCDESVLNREADNLEKSEGRKLQRFADFRRLLDSKDIDAVSIATPNHTHSLIGILAAQSGKDVYVEKPVSQTVWEGRQLAHAADRYNRIIQCGTQARSASCIRDAVAYVQGGKLGKVQCIVGTCYKARKSIGKNDRPLTIPKQLDYDLWCGPAAKVDLYRPEQNSVGSYNPHYDWHWDFNTGNGDMGNQGIHQMDVARWFQGATTLSPRVVSFGGRLGYEDAGNTANTQVVLHDYPEAPIIFETRGLPRSKEAQANWGSSMDTFRGSHVGVVVLCEDGYVVVSSSYDKVTVHSPDGQEIKSFVGQDNHFQNFLDAVRSRDRKDLNADIVEGHLSSALCHTGNISHRLGKPQTASDILAGIGSREYLRDAVERMFAHLRANEVNVDEPVVTQGEWLEMDTATERFTNNDAANELLHRQDRAPFVVPKLA